MKKYTDTNGREYALVSEVHVGDILIADGGFISDPPDHLDNRQEFFCLDKNEEQVVCKSNNRELFVQCKCGQHSLDGQYESRRGYYPFYMGFYKKQN